MPLLLLMDHTLHLRTHTRRKMHSLDLSPTTTRFPHIAPSPPEMMTDVQCVLRVGGGGGGPADQRTNPTTVEGDIYQR